MYHTAETDEFWSFVEKKSNQRWTWCAIDKASGIVLAWHNGNRTDADFQQLLGYIENIPIVLYFSDDWEDRHYIGKNQTWKIERKNLNFRIHLKR